LRSDAPTVVIVPVDDMGFGIPSAFGSGADMRVPARHRIFERGNAAIEGRPDLMIGRKLMTPYNGIRVYKVDPCSGVEGRPPRVSVSSASFRPRRTVSAATPVAAATTATPPGPNSAASAPSHNRRANSLRCGRTTANRRASESARSAIAQP
jgi:hypothetical protein